MIRTLLFPLTLLIFWPLSALAADCPESDPNNPLAYIQRDNDRCEGLANFITILSVGQISLASLSTHALLTLDTQPDLTLQIPNVGTTEPFTIFTAKDSSYRMDPFQLNSDDPNAYTFTWSTQVLNQIGILDPNQLRALALTGNPRIYIPVILQQPGSSYTIVLQSPTPVSFDSIQIQTESGEILYTTDRPIPKKGETVISWNGLRSDGTPAPAGRYRLSYQGTEEPTSGPPKAISNSFTFEHNPDWLETTP